MINIEEFSGTMCLDSESLMHTSITLTQAASEIHALIYEKNSPDVSWEDSVKTLVKYPVLAVGLHLMASLESFNFDYLQRQNTTHLLLQEAIKKIELLATIKPDSEV